MIVVPTIVGETMLSASEQFPCPTLRCCDKLPGIVPKKSWITDPLDSSLEPCALVSSFFGLEEGN